MRQDLFPTASVKLGELVERQADRIAEAAMAVIDEYGTAGFTMRAVAKVLNVTPMALYHHVKDKAELAAIMVDATMRQIPLPPTCGTWREDLISMSKWIREITHAHPAARHLRRDFQIFTPTVLQVVERWLSLWQQSELSFEKALLAARSSSTAITGFVMEEITIREITPPEASTLSMLPNARIMVEGLYDQSREFELAAIAIIDGIYGQLKEK